MEAISQGLGLTVAQFTQLLVLAATLGIGLVLLRVFLKLTAAIFRTGCIGIVLLIAAFYVFSIFAT